MWIRERRILINNLSSEVVRIITVKEHFFDNFLSLDIFETFSKKLNVHCIELFCFFDKKCYILLVVLYWGTGAIFLSYSQSNQILLRSVRKGAPASVR